MKANRKFKVASVVLAVFAILMFASPGYSRDGGRWHNGRSFRGGSHWVHHGHGRFVRGPWFGFYGVSGYPYYGYPYYDPFFYPRPYFAPGISVYIGP